MDGVERADGIDCDRFGPGHWVRLGQRGDGRDDAGIIDEAGKAGPKIVCYSDGGGDTNIVGDIGSDAKRAAAKGNNFGDSPVAV
jgi:hypothetical protein